MRRHSALVVCIAAALAPALQAQTTQSTITGRVIDRSTNLPVPGAAVTYTNTDNSDSDSVKTDDFGLFVLPLLSPGTYVIRAEKDLYQPQELHELQLFVASRLDFNFSLRPASDLWSTEANRYSYTRNERVVNFYATDVASTLPANVELLDPKASSLLSSQSYVIDSRDIDALPLAGRDVYAILSLLPGVTTDSTTGRGLGLSVNGQRPSSSNTLLDGLENNNYLITGPLSTVVPEAVQEYRVSLANYSAEYGRTSGYIANAITRPGTARWHGMAYSYLKREALNANDFQRNLINLPRNPLSETEYGFALAGPLGKRGLFASVVLDTLRFHSFFDPQPFSYITTAFKPDPNTAADYIVRHYRLPVPPAPGIGVAMRQPIAPPSTLNRDTLTHRLDYIPGGSHRVSLRLAGSRFTRPDFGWTPYPDFVIPLYDNAASVAVSWLAAPRPEITNEFRAGWTFSDLHFDRPHAEIPVLETFDSVGLPGSQAFYSYRNRERNAEFIENLSFTSGRHTPKAGGGLLLRRIYGYQTTGAANDYKFADVQDFAQDRLFSVERALPRLAPPASADRPDYRRSYAQNQFFLFAQDSFKIAPRLVLNYGVRYENFGVPVNTGPVKDPVVSLASGSNLAERLTHARIAAPGPGDQQLYSADSNNWAGRVGFAWRARAQGATLIRGGYGIFYDRPMFDNLWQDVRINGILIQNLNFDVQPIVDYLDANAVLSKVSSFSTNSNLSRLTLIQPGLRTPYVQSYLLAAQQELGTAFTAELNVFGAFGRKLITTDIVNRVGSVARDFDQNPQGLLNPDLKQVYYRGNQGTSRYNALAAMLRYRSSRSRLQVSYTWSHSIDNQSEPLGGELYDLGITTAAAQNLHTAQFTRQFDSSADLGNSDFDQRHNLVFFSIWDLPAILARSRVAALFRAWRVSQVAAFRSGLPFSVMSGSVRANIADASHISAGGKPVDGGKLLLNDFAFRAPSTGIGNSSRNQFYGPGLYNLDLSLSRSFLFRRMGETARVSLRADAFNLLNHANLNNPVSLLGPFFGTALFGRAGVSTGFPSLTPFRETARQVQLLFRFEF